MAHKALDDLIRGLAIDALLLDELALSRGPATPTEGMHVQEVSRQLLPQIQGDRLVVTLRLQLLGSATGQNAEAPVADATLFRLVISVSAHYRSATPIIADAVQSFANSSALMHLNAYMRQYVQETLTRAGFPGVVMPLAGIATPNGK